MSISLKKYPDGSVRIFDDIGNEIFQFSSGAEVQLLRDFAAQEFGKPSPEPTKSTPPVTVGMIQPFAQADYISLLKAKPVAEWQQATTFLHDRSLLLLPRKGANFAPSQPDPQYVEQQKKAKEARAKAHAALLVTQQTKKKARAAARAKAHQERTELQAAAAVKKTEAKAKTYAQVVKAAADRTAKVPTVRVQQLTKGADVKRWLEHHTQKLCEQSDATMLQRAVARLHPLVIRKTSFRPIRANFLVADLLKGVPALGEIPSSVEKAFAQIQDQFRAADRHLFYLYHEKNLPKVVKQRTP